MFSWRRITGFLKYYPTHFLEGLPGARNTRGETESSGISLEKKSVRFISFLYMLEISTLNIHKETLSQLKEYKQQTKTYEQANIETNAFLCY